MQYKYLSFAQYVSIAKTTVNPLNLTNNFIFFVILYLDDME